MPNIKSAKKRVKVIETKSMQNQMVKSALKTSIKKFDADKTAENYAAAVKKIDQAASKGVLHKNTAARKKSSLTKALNANA
ncbi:MAG: 30S ribosomal protein S20 [Clostridia bacterium]|nr:30S ribosomal protein S20 [Clostridia bacterium]